MIKWLQLGFLRQGKAATAEDTQLVGRESKHVFTAVLRPGGAECYTAPNKKALREAVLWDSSGGTKQLDVFSTSDAAPP